MLDLNELQYDSLKGADIRFDANDLAPNYIGIHQDTNANTATKLDWVIYKFTYDGDNVTRIQKAKGAWDNRASLF